MTTQFIPPPHDLSPDLVNWFRNVDGALSLQGKVEASPGDGFYSLNSPSWSKTNVLYWLTELFTDEMHRSIIKDDDAPLIRKFYGVGQLDL